MVVVRALYRNRRAAGSIPVREPVVVLLHFSQLLLVRSNKCIKIYTFREAVSTKKREKTSKNPKMSVFLKIRSKIETTVKKDTARYSMLTQDIKRKVF
jgi:hypothetical protein